MYTDVNYIGVIRAWLDWSITTVFKTHHTLTDCLLYCLANLKTSLLDWGVRLHLCINACYIAMYTDVYMFIVLLHCVYRCL